MLGVTLIRRLKLHSTGLRGLELVRVICLEWVARKTCLGLVHNKTCLGLVHNKTCLGLVHNKTCLGLVHNISFCWPCPVHTSFGRVVGLGVGCNTNL